MAIKAQKGYYTVKNGSKIMLPTDKLLVGRILKDKQGNVVYEYRSKWEAYLMMALEVDDNVVKWGYENDIIQYYDPTTILPDGSFKKRNYYIDFVIYYKDGRVEFVEVKPYYQTIEPVIPKTKNKKSKKYDIYLKAVETYAKNQAKWKYARKKCENLSLSFGVNFSFEIYTEKDKLKGIIK